MEAEVMLEDYIDRLEEIGKAETTINTYKHTLSSFIESLDKPLDEVKEKDIRRFLKRDGELKARTKKSYCIRIFKFFDWLIDEEDLNIKNPAKKLREEINEHNGDDEEKEVLTIEQVRNLIQPIESPKIKAMLLVLYKTGIRCMELAGLDKSDVDFNTGKIIIKRRKGGKRGYVYADEEALKWLKFYLSTRWDDNEALFVCSKGRITRHNLSKTIIEALKRAGYEGLTVHDWRHIFTTHMRQAGCDLEVIRVLRGDSPGNMTEYYTHYSEEDIRKEYLRTIPKLYV